MMREPEDTSDLSDDASRDAIDESLSRVARRPRSAPAVMIAARSYAPPRLLLPGQDTLPDEPRRVVLDIPTELTPRPPEAVLLAELASNKPRARFLAMAIGIAFALPLIVIGRWSVLASRPKAEIAAAPVAATDTVTTTSVVTTSAPAAIAAPSSAVTMSAPAANAAPSSAPAPNAPAATAGPASTTAPAARPHGSKRRATKATPPFVPPNAAQFREDFTR